MSFNKRVVNEAISSFLTGFSADYTQAFAAEVARDLQERESKTTSATVDPAGAATVVVVPVVQEDERELLPFMHSPPALSGYVRRFTGVSNTPSEEYWTVTGHWSIQVWKSLEDAELADAQIQAGLKTGLKQPLRTLDLWGYKAARWVAPTKACAKWRGGPSWVSDKDRKACHACEKKFGPLTRRHHCRTCGEIFCLPCCGQTWNLQSLGYVKSQKVCNSCWDTLHKAGVQAFGRFDPAQRVEHDFGVALTHRFRPPHFFLCEDGAARRDWISAVYICSQNASAPRNDHELAHRAFVATHRKYWSRHCAAWDWWQPFGTEREMLQVLLTTLLEDTATRQVLAEMSVPKTFRPRAEVKVHASIQSMVSARVEQVWPYTVQACMKSEKSLRAKLLPLLDPLRTTQARLDRKLRDKVGSAIQSAIGKVASPLLTEVLPMTFGPLLNCHILAYGVMSDLFKQLRDQCELHTTTMSGQFRLRVAHVRLNIRHTLQRNIVTPELEPMELALRMLGTVPPFNFLNPSAVRLRIYRDVEQLLHDALFALQNDSDMLAGVETGNTLQALDAAYPGISKRYYNDSKILMQRAMGDLLRQLIGLPLHKIVWEADSVQDAMAVIEAQIPDELREVLTAEDCFRQLMDDIVADLVQSTVSNNAPASINKLKQGWHGMNSLEDFAHDTSIP
jgi:hypothetical protein